jgi:FeS assembly SUF system protein
MRRSVSVSPETQASMNMDKPHRVPLETIEEQPAPSAPAPAEPAAATPDAPLVPAEAEAKIIAQLKTCYDPEIPVNIYELGLIYGIQVEPVGDVILRLTLTSPSCPAAGSLPGEVQQKAASVPGVKSVKVDLVWDPPWDPSRMSEAARLQLGMDYD